jgi:hypothetical protein
MRMTTPWLFAGLALLGVLVSGCSRIGPDPNIMAVESEIKATKSITRILVQPTLGTGEADQDQDINKVVPAMAYERYDDNIVLSSGLSNTLETLDMPDGYVELLPVNWQVAFYRWVKQKGSGKKPPAKGDLSFAVPPSGKKVAKTDKDLEKLAKALEKRKKALEPMRKAIATAKPDEIDKAAAKYKGLLVPVENLNRHIMERLETTYVLVSYIDGTENDFEGDEPITLHVALVNSSTGKFRYYAKSFAKKSDLPANRQGLISIMAKNMFDDIKGKDKVEF